MSTCWKAHANLEHAKTSSNLDQNVLRVWVDGETKWPWTNANQKCPLRMPISFIYEYTIMFGLK
jgi:hypothetical protein